MKYFVIADVHGFYDEMINALDNAGFDRDNPDHCLISLGDVTDRGDQPLEVINYLMGLERKILIRGNHEDLVQELLSGRKFQGTDYTNGTFETIIKLAEDVRGFSISEQLARIDWERTVKDANSNLAWHQYFAQTVNYAEIGKYILVHGWIPCDWVKDSKFDPMGHPVYNPNWREAKLLEWETARWTCGLKTVQYEVFEPNKTIVCGHWMTCDFHAMFEGKDEDDFSPYITDNVIACDACTAYSGQVNVVVLEIKN